jgi:hypothetical protein
MVLSGQFVKLCQLHYWNGTVLNVAHGMIHVLLAIMMACSNLHRADSENDRCSRQCVPHMLSCNHDCSVSYGLAYLCFVPQLCTALF